MPEVLHTEADGHLPILGDALVVSTAVGPGRVQPDALEARVASLSQPRVEAADSSGSLGRALQQRAPGGVLSLQRAIGNAAVTRLVTARKQMLQRTRAPSRSAIGAALSTAAGERRSPQSLSSPVTDTVVRRLASPRGVLQRQATQTLTGDTEIREWLRDHSYADIGNLPEAEKLRLINRLLKGWVSDDDLTAIHWVCGGVTDRSEMARIDAAIRPQVKSLNARQGAWLGRILDYRPGPSVATLEAEKTSLEAITKSGSGKSFGEVASSFAKLKDVTHDLSILKTGTGTYVGSQCAVQPSGALPTDCTTIVLEVLENTFTQQGRAADWAKVKKKYAENTKARGGSGLSGLDVQAALQSEAGWKGVFWAPDPRYQIPKAELDKANPDEASYTYGKAKKGTYYKDYGKPGYPGVSIDQTVTNYAPEAPNPGHGTASTSTKDMTQLDKLKKLPFGVLAAHGGEHMTVITYGKVIEVHWAKEATDPNLIEQTSLEQWAVGPRSGYHYYASGAIVAPAADLDAAFR